MIKQKTTIFSKLPFLLCIGLLVIPYDAIPHSMPSVYKPICVYFFSIVLFLLLLKYKFCFFADKTTKYVLLFLAYSVLVGFITAIWYTKTPSYYLNEILPIIMGIITFLACKLAFDHFAVTTTADNYFLSIFKLLGVAYLIPTFVAFLDICVVYGPLPMVVKDTIQSIFGGFQSSRITGTTYEASWLSRHMMFAMFIYLYLFKRTKKRYYTVLIGLTALAYFTTFSLQGILVLLAGIVLFVLVNAYLDKNFSKTLFRVVVYSVIAIALYALFYYIVVEVLPPSYITYRLRDFIDISTLVRTEGSSFIRIYFPVLNLFLWRDHFLLGVGPGSFSYFYPEYADRYAPWRPHTAELDSYYYNLSAPAESTFFSSLSQFGIVGAYLYYRIFFSLFSLYKKLKSVPCYKNILLWSCVTIAFLLQAGSYAYSLFWVMVAVISSSQYTTDLATHKNQSLAAGRGLKMDV